MVTTPKTISQIFEILNEIKKLTKMVNTAMSLQVMLIIIKLFVMGLLLIFTSTLSFADTRLNTTTHRINFFVSSTYAHLIIIQLAYLANSIKEEV